MFSDIIALSTLTFDEMIFFFQEHQYLISVLTPLVTGEISIHIFGILNGSGDISLLPSIVTLVSMLVFDMIIYFTVRALNRHGKAAEKIRKIKILKKFEKIFQKCEERYSNYPGLLLFAIKVMPMTKLTMPFYTLYSKTSTARFILQDIIITFIWAVIVFLPGWLVGKEFLTQEAGRKVSSFILYFLILVMLVTLFSNQIDRVILAVINKIKRKLDQSRENQKSEGSKKNQRTETI